MTPLLAGAVLTLAQGPYGAAPPGEAPADAPIWIAEQAAEEQAVEEHAFRVTAEFECPAGTVDGLLQVSISDTVVRAELDGEEDGAGRRVLTLRVPGKQLQGLKPELFCPRSPGPAQQAMRLASRFTAQGALICRNADVRNTSARAAATLDAWVVCPAETGEAGETAERAEAGETGEAGETAETAETRNGSQAPQPPG